MFLSFWSVIEMANVNFMKCANGKALESKNYSCFECFIYIKWYILTNQEYVFIITFNNNIGKFNKYLCWFVLSWLM
jgi:hypothetical protein